MTEILDVQSSGRQADEARNVLFNAIDRVADATGIPLEAGGREGPG